MMDMIVSQGSMPMITWMSIPATGGNPLGCGDPNWNLDSIISGSHDDFITQFAEGIASYPHTVFLRWGHEMNVNQYSWAGYCNGANAEATTKFVAAYRHIHDIFMQQGATNVKFVWSPNYQSFPDSAGDGWNDIENYYPGDDYVDWIGVVGYNWGRQQLEQQFPLDVLHGPVRWILKNHGCRSPVQAGDGGRLRVGRE